MTSQMSLRYCNRILSRTTIRPRKIQSLTIRCCGRNLHNYRDGINPQEWNHRRKIASSLQGPSKQIPSSLPKEASCYILYNRDITSQHEPSESHQGASLSASQPCSKCNILGTFCSADCVPTTDAATRLFSFREATQQFQFSCQPTALSSGDSPDSEDALSCSDRMEFPAQAAWKGLQNWDPLYSKPRWTRAQKILQGYHPLSGLTPLSGNCIVLRALHTSRRRPEESKSKVEDTVKALKEEVMNKKQEINETKEQDGPVSTKSTSNSLSSETAAPPSPAAPPKKSIGQRIVAELKHYYHGFRLLFIDVRVCARYLWNVLRGRTLSRRERRQLVRTTADLFRLVPFLVFIVVPFMEFLLPVALKLFPGMLPSTFSEEKKEQETMRKKLKGKLEMAKFLQDTLEEMALQVKGSDESRVHEFNAFLKRIRSSGEETTNEEIVKYSKLFKDEITLDSLGHDQLSALCKLVDLHPLGTNAFLRFQLRMKLRQLETDDRMIQKEGVESLAVWELQEACRARGMRSLGVSTQRLKTQLQQWLDLHLEARVPTSLLLLSRTLYLPPTVAPEEQLKATLSTLPETTAEEAKVTISEVAGERVDNKTKLEIIRQEEEAIQKEREETEKEAQEEAKKKEEAVKAEPVVAKAEPEVIEPVPEPLKPEEVAKVLGVKEEEVLVDKAAEVEFKPVEAAKEPAAPVDKTKAEEEAISKKELEEVEEVLEAVAEERMSMKLEQEELEALKEDVTEYKENLEDLKEVVLATGRSVADIQESKGAQRLSKQVDKMVDQLHKLMGTLHEDKEQLTEEIEVREVRIKRSKELQEDQDMRQEVLDQIKTKKANLIGINELLLSMKRLQKISDDTKFQRIMEVLDEDKDGKIDIDDALKVMDLLGRENVKVSPSKMSEILELLRTEAQLEEEKKKEKETNKAKAEEFNADTVDSSQPPAEEILKDPAAEQAKKQQNQQ